MGIDINVLHLVGEAKNKYELNRDAKSVVKLMPKCLKMQKLGQVKYSIC